MAEWVAVHIYYAANSTPVLVHCVRPLVRDLFDEGLLENYFFINYWLEGPHVRLRLKPATPEATDEVKRRAEEAIEGFLRRRPALYEFDGSVLSGIYNTMLDVEFPGDTRTPYLDDTGSMRIRDNNSYAYQPYEPEYGRYGGPAGMALAEWHFRHSSDLAIQAGRSLNYHMRPVLLGSGAQLMMIMSAAFIAGTGGLARYLQAYSDYWSRTFSVTEFIDESKYEARRAEVAPRLGPQFEAIRHAIATGRHDLLPDMYAGWADHCVELASRARALAVAGQLEFSNFEGTSTDVVTDPEHALPRLLSSYMHMTNNRIGVTVTDEGYLSHVLSRCLVGEPAEVS